MKSHTLLVIALILGAALGIVLHPFAEMPALKFLLHYGLEPMGQVFLRLIFMIVVPMVFTGLVLGVHELTRHHDLGRILARTLGFTLILSSASVLVGVTAVNLLRPGEGMAESLRLNAPNGVAQVQAHAAAAKPVVQSILEIIPKNPVEAAAKAFEGEMLALMFFALIFGMALTQKSEAIGVTHDHTLIKVLERIYDACMVIVAYAMRFAPAAVFALVLTSTLRFGSDLLISLSKYVGVVILALCIQQFGVYALALKIFGKTSPWKFFEQCRDVYLYAFATASSNATLPRSLETAETQLKLPAQVSRFVLTVGSTANQNGTALFEGVTVLFLAQVYGIDLSLAQQLQVVVMSILAGVGTAGVPGGSLPLILILIQQLGIPAEGMGLILGVDRLLDMCRTTVNVSGDLVIAKLVSRGFSSTEKR